MKVNVIRLLPWRLTAGGVTVLELHLETLADDTPGAELGSRSSISNASCQGSGSVWERRKALRF